ncbi:TetR/AcrR family transcriptional regulator [Microtetraspora sp. NBRC 16547]|uniref:TetR/AcrR family transcriptional regulator n=1 Tax=Microtetraspora sp. NBRC 16547 TaxID=3030993 RepID=UPI0024A3FC0C|nr:TetR/AcrR family transcriptional regulator [Microtetraspora sp. NBRC 16547]GLW97861.1 TetR family transcriptional regulator [Microtetraspora sp. NBRC 16547]
MEGLRERKKRETRQRIADIAMGLFMQKGFDNVTVAEIARSADVSVNTVFNYFKTKEDLFLDRSDEVEGMLARVVRDRRPGESAVEAVRRDFFDALDTGDWRYGLSRGSEVFARLVEQSPALMSRMRELHQRREALLAETLADESDADPDDLTPWVVAVQICSVTRILAEHFARRGFAGEDPTQITADLRVRAGHAFDLLEHGAGGYCARPDEGAAAEPAR